ncbi:FtsK/SpoIIIE domain-containing protein [Planosporangium sp. 12N6]|uniref:FtsK/SpoIIIE domain-containing protein n=1 Tax=Planosporangium spinosum TaxID=3402278 RepID=UPI003CF6ABE6
MPDRTPVIERVERRLGMALRLVDRERGYAHEAHRTALARLARAEREAVERPARAARERDAALHAIDERHAKRLAELAVRARDAAVRAAAGAAGEEWPRWRPTPVDRAARFPPLRIGRVTVAVTPGGPGPTGPGDPGNPWTAGLAVPALVPFLDHGHVALTGDDRTAVDAVLTALLLRTVGTAPPGAVRLYGYDPEQLGGGLAGFAPLAGAEVLTFVTPRTLGDLLDRLTDEVQRRYETVLAGEYASLADRAGRTGRRAEPWQALVLLGDGRDLDRHARAQLDALVRAGAAGGVHVLARGVPLIAADQVTTVRVDGATATVNRYPGLTVTLDPPPPAPTVAGACREFAAKAGAGARAPVFADLAPTELWTHSSADGLTAPVGEGPDGEPVEVTLGDHPPHALIGGPSGSGKTNVIYAWLAALTSRYSPAELELYLLDFKEGVSFARFAPGRRDRTWLPHVRLVGVNANTDREFGLALLRFLGAELRRRAEAAKRFEVTKLGELRAEDPDGHWPRIVAVVDEFQVLVAGRDALATEAVTLLEDLARRGRSQGIHLVMASQDVSGIQALWGRSGLVGQFSLRVALPKARRILVDETNDAAQRIPRHHAVVNADSGVATANRVVRLPEAHSRSDWQRLMGRMWQRYEPGDPPRLFDGDAVPTLAEAPELAVPTLADVPGPGQASGAGPVALLGQAVDVTARSARLTLSRTPGRNLAVLGTRTAEAGAVLGAAAVSLGRWYRPGEARFSVACLDPGAEPAARTVAAALAPLAPRWYDPDSVTDLLAETAADLTGPHILLLYAADAVSDRLAVKGPGGSGHEHLRRILHGGPERGTHVLGWWRTVSRLRDDLGGVGARFDAIGAWVALDVHGADLNPLSPQPNSVVWYPRPWRGLYFDRSSHRAPEVLIPYGPAP